MSKKRGARGTNRKKKAKKASENESEVEIKIIVHNKDPWMKMLHWSARILGILIILFWLAILITHGLSLATMMESIVLLSFIAVLLCAWKYEIAGGAVYILLGLVYVLVTMVQANWTAILVVATPPLVTGGLFISEGMIKKRQ